MSKVNRELSSPTQSGWRGLGRWPIVVVPLPAPGGKASGAADRCMRPSCHGSMPQTTSPIVTESVSVDHLDMVAERDSVERLRDVHLCGYCFAWRLMLVEARKHSSRNGEQGRFDGVPLFEVVTDRDPGPGRSLPFLVIIIPVPVPVIFRNKPGLTGTIFTKVLFVQDCKYLF